MTRDDENKIEKVAIYMRVSREEQAIKGFSLGSQLERLKAYCLAREWKISGEYTDPGFTGRNLRRPAYQQMFDEQNMWDAVLVVKMDRIHRNSKNFMEMIRSLREHDKGFVSMSESIDTSTAMGRFVTYVLSLVAQLESEQLSERIIDGKIQQAKTPNSGWMGSLAPRGYRYDKTKKKIYEVPKELEVIKEIFRIYDEENMPMRAIAKRLGITRSAVVHALCNPFYAGYVRWCEYLRPTGLEPLISVELFNRVQKKKRRRNMSTPHLLPFLIPESNGEDIIQLDPKKLQQTARETRPRHSTQL